MHSQLRSGFPLGSPARNVVRGPRALVFASLLAAGCAGVAPSPQPAQSLPGPFTAPASAAAARPASAPSNVNLQGFPPEYRQGYADGCASASGNEKKDGARFKSDGQYRTGWQDGIALCKTR